MIFFEVMLKVKIVALLKMVVKAVAQMEVTVQAPVLAHLYRFHLVQKSVSSQEELFSVSF